MRYALVVCCFRLIFGVLQPATFPEEPSLACVEKLMRVHLARTLRYYGSERPLLRALNAAGAILIGGEAPAQAYVVAASRNTNVILHALPELAAATDWNPLARFLVVVDQLQEQDLRPIFDAFLRVRSPFVLLVNGTRDAHLYTYNPHTQNACGNYYIKVQALGTCDAAPAVPYPVLPPDPLRNCFFNVSVADWPPFAIDLTQSRERDPAADPTSFGVEEYVFHLMSEVEGFQYRFKYDYDPELFSIVSKNLSVEGPLTQLSSNTSDVMLGGLLLLSDRARAFSFVHGHLDLHDEVRFVVRRAELAQTWSDPYSCFSLTLWVVVVLCLPVWALLVMHVARARDAGAVQLALLEGLLGRGVRLLRASATVRRLLLVWVLFGFLFNNFYSTMLVSFTTSPRRVPQIADEEMLASRGLQPCISSVIGRFLQTEAGVRDALRNVTVGGKGCTRLLSSVRTVSRSHDRFSLVIYSVYMKNRYAYYDIYGQDSLYTFREPYSKTIYAMYWNRGAPVKRLRKLALRVRETGLVQKHLEGQYFREQIKFRFKSREWSARFAPPWHLYAAGLCLATLTLLAELASSARGRPYAGRM